MAFNEYGEWEDGEDINLSPWEEAHGGHEYDPDSPDNAPNDFDEWTEDIYAGSTPDTDWSQVDDPWNPGDDINLYEPPDNNPNDGGNQWVEGIPEDWQRDFISRNPGDYSRIRSAYGSNNFEDGDSGEGQASGGTRQRTPYQGATVQMGADPFSQLIQGGYADLLANRGQTPFGREMEGILRGLIERGGEIEEDPTLLAQRMEARRQPIEAFRRMQTNQYKGQLADRGLLSEPGMPQGTEISAAGRLEEELAPWYASAGQNLASEMGQERGQRFDRAVTLGTGLAGQQSQDFLNALRGGTERQATLSDIALGTLDRNIAWNRFLAEFGMDRDIALEQLQSGRTDDVNQLLDLFQDYVTAAREGYR